MKGQNGAAVTLSQLTEGNYRFKVTVTSSVTNSIGEAYANVTVLPANRMNKAPVVVITPSSQNVKLPNNVAVLDGSDSKVCTFLVLLMLFLYFCVYFIAVNFRMMTRLYLGDGN